MKWWIAWDRKDQFDRKASFPSECSSNKDSITKVHLIQDQIGSLLSIIDWNKIADYK